ncbi:MAG: tyrosinase family protein [Actinobacteria bacterium]|nr:tyrosinase family protein [Actinomycetota bacterium]
MSIRYRKNIDCLTTNELHDLREALSGIYLLPASNPNSFARQATFHGGPPVSYCRHGAPGFFTWHRAEVKAFETALQSVRCDVMLPFWGWSTGPSTGIPSACRVPNYVDRAGATVPNPLYAGPRNAGGMTTRSPSADTTAFDDLATSIQSAMTEPSFATFQSLVNGPHGSVHGRVGGDMCCVPTASFDPIFFLHHANVDRIWARWQSLHPGTLPANEAAWELPPFNRPFTTQWQQGSDVESTEALGYRYRTFCFFLPPIRIWEVFAIEWTPKLSAVFGTARLMFKSRRMQDRAMEVRLFINDPDATARTKTIGNPAYAGVAGFMGHGVSVEVDPSHCRECLALGHDHEHAHHQDHPTGHDRALNAEEAFDVALDFTNALRKVHQRDDRVSLKLVAVDLDGNEVAADDFAVDEIELVIE